MNTQPSPSFIRTKPTFTCAVATILSVLVSAGFVIAIQPLKRAGVGNITSEPVVLTVQASVELSVVSTPASMSYHDQINVSAISVAAYDR